MNRIGRVESTRERDGKVSRETRFFIGSIGTGVADFGRAVRGHWGVENELHWSLDVAMCEDDSRVRETQARENLAVLRHIAMSRLKNDSTKLGIKTKHLKAGWDEPHLENLLVDAPRTAGQRAPSGTLAFFANGSGEVNASTATDQLVFQDSISQHDV
jgi:predicted transposase YbfD/YdcC